MSTENKIKFRVAVCGGGIGGLALAAFINHHSTDIKVDVYEARAEITTVGTGISIWKRTWEGLLDLQLDIEAQKRGFNPPKDGEVSGPIFRKSDDPNGGFDFHSHIMPYGSLSLPRPTILDMLRVKTTKFCTIHPSKTLKTYETLDSGSILLRFTDGTESETDVLVGCDGVHSATRATMFSHKDELRSYIKPVFSGTLAYRTSVDLQALKSKYPDHTGLTHPKIWCGRGKHAVTIPMGPKLMVIGYCNVEGGEGQEWKDPRVVDVEPQELLDRYQGWEPDLIHVLELVARPSRWAIHVVKPLPFYVSGRVALLGDAAHAMTPHQGVGGGQAFEDAYILGQLLAHPKTNLSNIAQVLKVYETIRLPFSQEAAETSRNNGFVYDFMHPDYPVGVDAGKEELEKLGKEIGRSFAWLGKAGCVSDWKKAEAVLVGSL